MAKQKDNMLKKPAHKIAVIKKVNTGENIPLVIAEEEQAMYVSKKRTGQFLGISASGSYGADIILTGIAHKPETQMTAIEKMDLVRLGVSKKDLENLKEIAELDYDELSKALSVTRATLINKKGEDKFNASLSERIIGLADIYSYGYGVFEDEDQFNKWMFRPNQALGGKAPYDFVDNQYGREEVRNIIGRIAYGVYS